MTDPAVPAVPEATVIAPAYNEEAALPAVIAALGPLRDAGVEVVVVDDGSTDGTAGVAEAMGVRVVRLETNRGKAEAVRAGLAAASGAKIVVIDADATYPANAIPAIIRLLDDYDVVLGARTEGRGHIPPLNRFGNATLRTVIDWFSGFGSADPLTGLYGLRREHLVAMNLQSRGFGLEAEIGVKAARMGLRWVDLPITYAERIGESKLRPVRDGVVITWTVIRTLFAGPRIRAAAGHDNRLRPAPLALVATGLSIGLTTVAALVLLGVLGTTVAALIDPSAPHTTTGTGAAALTLLAGVVLWRLVTRWGRPGAGMLAPVAVIAIAGGAAVLAGAVLVASGLRLVADTAASNRVRSVILLLCALCLVAAPLAWPLASRARAIRDRLIEMIRPASGVASPGEALALGAALLAFALPVARSILLEPIFFFDEAIYANTARSWLEGTPNSGWSEHRSPGISVLGLPAVPIGRELAFRLVGLLAGIATVLVAWALARRLGGRAVGMIAAFAVATIPAMTYNSSFFLTDVPSTAVVLLLMLVAWNELEERPAPSRRLLWLAPIAASAFYIRYGASVPILAITLTAILLWHRSLLRWWRLTLATAALFGVLLVPHLVQSTLLTGSPVGIARMAQSLASPAYPGEALTRYLSWIPGYFAGPVGDSLLIIGLLSWPVALGVDGLRARIGRAQTFLLLPAVAQFAVLGWTALPISRYVLVAMVLAVVAGALALGHLTRRLSWPSRQALTTAGILVTLVVGLAAVAVTVRREAARARTGDELITAARLVAADAGGESCAILGYPPPELAWYSACAVEHFAFPPAEDRDQLLRAERRYLLLTVNDHPRYPSGALRQRYRALADEDPMAIVDDVPDGRPAFEIYRLPDGR